MRQAYRVRNGKEEGKDGSNGGIIADNGYISCSDVKGNKKAGSVIPVVVIGSFLT